MLNILLAEDNLGDILLVQQALEQHQVKHELHVVNDGAEAIEYIERMGETGGTPCPDLMLLDLNLPKADGSQVLTAFRRHPQCGSTPVIVVTSSNTPTDRDQMARLGISSYFRKPSDLDAFLRLGGVVREVAGL